MLTRTSQVALNTLTSYGRYGVSLVVFFFLTPYMVQCLGTDGYGLWSFVLAVLGFCALIDLGFGTSTVKFVAECRGSGEVERRNRILSTIALAYGLLAVLGVFIVGGLHLSLEPVFHVPSDQAGLAAAVLWVLGVRYVFLALPLSLYRGVLTGEQRMWVVNGIQAASMAAYGVAAWLALARGGGILWLAWVSLGSMLLEHGAYVGFAYATSPGLRIRPSLVDRRLLGEVLSFSSFAFIGSVASLVLLRTDPLLVKLFLPLSSVALYSVALRIVEQAHLLTKQFVNALTPLIAELRGAGDEEKLRFVLVNCTRFALAPTVALGVGIVCCARPGLVLWIGEDFAAAAPVLQILTVAMVLAMPQLTASNLLAMTGHHRFTGIAGIFSAVLNIVVSVALVRWLGIAGIALGTLAATLVIDICFVVRKACAVHAVGPWSYVRRAIVPAAWPGVVQAGLTAGLLWWRAPASLGMLVVLAAVPAGVYVVLFWFFGVEASEKTLFREKLLRFRQAPAEGGP